MGRQELSVEGMGKGILLSASVPTADEAIVYVCLVKPFTV